MWFVYIIKSERKRWYYVGSTNRLEERIIEHNTLKTTSTKAYAPLKLVFKTNFETEKEARAYERKLKDCRMEKDKIIKNIENHCGIV